MPPQGSRESSRLQMASFPSTVLTAVAESLLHKVKCGGTDETDLPKRENSVVLPYVHSFAQQET